MMIKLVSLALLLCSPSVFGITVTLDEMRSTSYSYAGVAIDHSTGKYYERRHFDGNATGGNTYHVYADRAAFEAGTVLNTVTLATSSGTFGTYFAVRNGFLYGRSASNASQVAKWDLSTGLQVDTETLGGFDPNNPSGTFDLGGFTGLNIFSSSSGMYVVGGDATDTQLWRAELLSNNLDATFVTDVDEDPAIGNFGYGFMIGNELFLADSFSSGHISKSINLLSGVETALDITLAFDNGGASFGILNALYDELSDTLTLHSYFFGTYFELENAASEFGVSAVPLPAAAWLFISALVGLIGFKPLSSYRDR